MFHYDVNAIVAQLVLPHGDLLQTNVVLKHFSEVDGHTLANGFVHWIFDVQFLEGVVAGVQHT
jgi:hypothetical protein